MNSETFRKDLDPRLNVFANDLILKMKALGKDFRIIEAHRSKERQEILYAQGRTLPGKIVTNAKPGESKHNSFPSLAVDIVEHISGKPTWSGFILSEEYKKAVSELLKSYPDITWGGNWIKFPDRPHFELKKKAS